MRQGGHNFKLARLPTLLRGTFSPILGRGGKNWWGHQSTRLLIYLLYFTVLYFL